MISQFAVMYFKIQIANSHIGSRTEISQKNKSGKKMFSHFDVRTNRCLSLTFICCYGGLASHGS